MVTVPDRPTRSGQPFYIRLEDNGKLDNHLVYLCNETTSFSVDTVDGQVVVTFDTKEVKKH